VHKESTMRVVTKNLIVRLGVFAAVPFLLTHRFVHQEDLLASDVVNATMLLCLTLCDFRPPTVIYRPVEYFGKISCGMYMLYPLIILVTSKLLFLARLPMDNALTITALYLCGIGLTMLGASLSFEIFEQRFLRLKSKFAVVDSAS
jgi:peptidoglycan/LPS O-acetylase OafA/YrhL